MQPFTPGTIADLIVVLQKQDERAWRQMSAGFAAGFAMAVVLALKDKTFTQATGKLFTLVVRELGVIGIGFSGEHYMQYVVPIIIPLRVVVLFQQKCLIEFVLKV